MRKLQVLIKKLRPIMPVVIGLSLGISLNIIRMPISHEECVHLSKDSIDQKLHLSDSANNKNLMFKDGWEGKKLDFKPMSIEEAERYRKDREFAPPVYDSLEDFEPRIITDPELKPKINTDVEANKKKISRTRFISTELGIREKLVCSILTSTNTFKTLGFALNKTFSHHMKKVIFFSNLDQSNQNVPGAQHITLILHPTSNPSQFLHKTLEYLYDKFRDEYDWYFLATDSTYLEPTRIQHMVDHMSINRRLYMGKPESYSDTIGEITYCNIKNGFLISRLLLLDLMSHMGRCVKDADMDDLSPDKWLARCIKRASRGAVDCFDEEEQWHALSTVDDVYTGIIKKFLSPPLKLRNCQNWNCGIQYRSFDLDDSKIDFDPSKESSVEFKNAVTVSGVPNPKMMYSLHKRFSQIEIEEAYHEITEIQEEIKSLAPKLPEGDRDLSWPIGINPPFKPSSRWDILVWDYFTEDYTLTCPGELPKCELSGIDKIDVQNILQIAMERLNEKYNKQGLVITKKKLANGYRRFDPQRGMEYILDLILNVLLEGTTDPIEINHRVELLRPLSEVEIIPMPYVTESAKINIILPLTSEERPHFHAYMERYAKVCLNSDENVLLSIVFIYNPTDAQRIHDGDIFTEQKQLLQHYETRYRKGSDGSRLIPWVSIKTEVPSQLKVMDIVAKKHSTESLFFLSSVTANINVNFLNRCRMNTIQGWQTFFPLPFSSYNPDIIYKNVDVPEQIEIKPSNGHFDIYSFDDVCIYNSDYMATRTKMAASVDVRKTEETTAELADTLDIYGMLVKYSQLHIFRAVEPMLTRRYMHRTCNIKNGEEIYQRCERSNAEGLASRSQLAMELFPDEEDK